MNLAPYLVLRYKQFVAGYKPIYQD